MRASGGQAVTGGCHLGEGPAARECFWGLSRGGVQLRLTAAPGQSPMASTAAGASDCRDDETWPEPGSRTRPPLQCSLLPHLTFLPPNKKAKAQEREVKACPRGRSLLFSSCQCWSE